MKLRVLLAAGVLYLGAGSAWAGAVSASAASVRVQFDLSGTNTSIPVVSDAQAPSSIDLINADAPGSYFDVNPDTSTLYLVRTDPTPVDGTITYGVILATGRTRYVVDPTLPEPGSILLAIGAASLLALRRR